MKSFVLIIVSVLVVNGNSVDQSQLCPPGHLMDFVRGICWRNIAGCKATQSQWPIDDQKLQDSLDGDDRLQAKESANDPEQPESKYLYDSNNDLYQSQTPGLSVAKPESDQLTQVFELAKENDDPVEVSTIESPVDDNSENEVGGGEKQEEPKKDGVNELSFVGYDVMKGMFSECIVEVETLRKDIESLKSVAGERDQFTTALMNRINYLQSEQQDHIALLSDQNELLEANVLELEEERASRKECEELKDGVTTQLSEREETLDWANQKIDELSRAEEEQAGLLRENTELITKLNKKIARQSRLIQVLRAQISVIAQDTAVMTDSNESSMEENMYPEIFPDTGDF